MANSYKNSRSALTNLRGVLKTYKYQTHNIQAYIIPSVDAHQNEYIAACDKRREFISGFTGSKGTAVVTQQLAALWTDGRYFQQAEQQLSSDWLIMKEGLPGTPTQEEWLSNVLPYGSFVGVDPTLLSFGHWKTISRRLKSDGMTLVGLERNLIDDIWHERSLKPMSPVFSLSTKFTGEPWQDRVTNMLSDMKAKDASVLVLTALDDIAWLLNLRGADIEYNPVFFAYTVVCTDKVHLFIDAEKLTEDIQQELKNAEKCPVEIHPYESMYDFLGSICNESKRKVWVDNNASYAVVSLIPKAQRIIDVSPAAQRKAVKNEREIEGMKNAHIKDAVALCEFFCWLEENIKSGQINELAAVDKIEEYRKLQADFMGPSFETISCSGSNASIIHYTPMVGDNRIVASNELYLLDSGGQYRDGTTDVTRTIHCGVPTDYEKECFTRVLKGVIAVSSLRFPNLVKGIHIDSFARKSLWDVGLDYRHGTGHGVGMYLCVHEGPMGIHYHTIPNDPGLKEGMILSIEPGYYEDGKFGIRIENLALVVKADTKYEFRKDGFLTFEQLTLVPIQTKLLVPSMLTTEEIQWLNDYHLKCREVVGAALREQGKQAALQWLLKETEPLG